MDYFKAVTLCDGKMMSWSAHCNKYAVEYVIGQKAFPPFGGLLVFPTLAATLEFMRNKELPNPSCILRGKGEERRLSAWCTMSLANSRMQQAWEGKLKPLDADVIPWPDETIALEWFEPTEVLKL